MEENLIVWFNKESWEYVKKLNMVKVKLKFIRSDLWYVEREMSSWDDKF